MATTESSDTTMADFLGPRPALYTSRDLVQDSLRLLQENGGYGDIYCALMRVPGGDVKIALKRLRFGSEDDGRKVKGDLLDEAVVWFHLRHPNILPFYGFYLNRGDTFLISPFLENGSLLKYLNQNCKADRIKFILEIASGLVYLHKEGVIHGDVKAANVLVSLTGSTRLCDFGLSKFIDTAPGRSRESTVGSLNWISPERLVPSCPADMARTKQSDVYAFALTGYEILSGQTPFQELGEDIVLLIKAVCQQCQRPPQTPTHAHDGTSYAHLWGTLVSCWDQDPQKRPDMLTVYQGISTGYPEQCTIAQQEADSYASPPVPKRVRDIAGDEEPTRKRFRGDTVSVSAGLYHMGRAVAPKFMGGRLESPLSSIALPPKPEIIFGRDQEIETISHRLFTTVDGRFVMRGPGGIGKTTVVRAIAHHPLVIEKYGRRVIWVPCEEATSPELLLELLSRSVGIGSDPTKWDHMETIITFLRSSVSQAAPHLIICDNFETPWDAPVGQSAVADLLQALSSVTGLSLLLTTRGHTPPAAGRVLWTKPALEQLSPLSLEASRALYLYTHDDVPQDEHLDNLLQRLSYMPLAVRLAASYGSNTDATPASLLKRWNSRKITKMLDHSDERTESVKFSVDLSIRSGTMQRDPDALTLLTVLSHLPGGARREFIPNFAPFDADVVEEALVTLMKVSLIQIQAPTGFVTMLSPVRAVLLDGYPIEASHRDMLLSAYYELLAQHPVEPGKEDYERNVSLLRSEHANCEALLRHALDISTSEECIRAAHAFAVYLYWTSPDTDVISLAVEKARLLQTDTKLAILAQGLQLLGDNHRLRLEYGKAELALKEARSLSEELGDVRGEATALDSQSRIYYSVGRMEEAIGVAENARSLFDQIGDDHGKASALNNLGEIYRRITRYDDAVVAGEAARTIYSGIGYELGTGNALWGLALTFQLQGKLDNALISARQASESFSRIGREREVVIMKDIIAGLEASVAENRG